MPRSAYDALVDAEECAKQGDRQGAIAFLGEAEDNCGGRLTRRVRDEYQRVLALAKDLPI